MRLCLISIIVIVGLIGFACGESPVGRATGGEPSPATAPASPATAPASPATAPASPATAPAKEPAGGYEVSASDLLNEFENNAVAASGKYQGKDIRVNGSVSGVDFEVFTGDAYISLTSGGMFEMYEVWCMLDDVSQAGSVSSGDNVTVVGTFAGWDMLYATLEDCSIEK